MSCTAKRTRITDVYTKLQSGDVYDDPSTKPIRIDEGYQAQATPEEIARVILKQAFTPEADLSGIKVGIAGGNSEMYGADYTDGITKPWFDEFLRCAGMAATKVLAIPVSAIATDFEHDEIVTGGVSSAIGRVVVPTDTTDTNVYIVLTSGNFQAETITGSISGSATATGVEVDAGWSYQFDTSVCDRMSVRSEHDGQKSEMYNCVPTIQIVVDDTNIPRIQWELAGVIRKVTDVYQWLRDTTMTVATDRDTKLPPLFNNARFKDKDFSPVVDGTTTIDFGIERPARRNANADGGVEGYQLNGRLGMFSHRIDIPSNTDFDVMKDLFDTTSIKTTFRIGDQPLNTFWNIIRDGRLKPVVVEDQDGFAKFALESKMTGEDDKEFELVCI